ncbi:MAG: hypothetical protein KatS3mg019_2076 [Fimbriimonadales bacterium]|nr:MAG: hypothetical protein KatS3mg019_2076 [Fimbriimonadales bacterium]
MKYRIHKRVETKPDGRKIYYYTFEPAAPTDTPSPPQTPQSDSENGRNPDKGQET